MLDCGGKRGHDLISQSLHELIGSCVHTHLAPPPGREGEHPPEPLADDAGQAGGIERGPVDAGRAMYRTKRFQRRAMPAPNPTTKTYEGLNGTYGFFNERLFENQSPSSPACGLNAWAKPVAADMRQMRGADGRRGPRRGRTGGSGVDRAKNPTGRRAQVRSSENPQDSGLPNGLR